MEEITLPVVQRRTPLAISADTIDALASMPAQFEIDGYQVRLRRTCQETRPLLVSLDGYVLAEERRYREADSAQVLAAFREARSATIEQISHIGNDELSRPAIFEGYGEITLKALIHLSHRALGV